MTDWGRTSYTLTSDDLKPLHEMGMAEFMRSKGFKPGTADGNPPEIWFNGVPYQHPGAFWDAPDYWAEAVQQETRRGRSDGR